MQELEMLKKKVEVLGNDLVSMRKVIANEFRNINAAFMKFGNLIDLQYLQTAVLIELLDKKKIFTEGEFKTQLEITGKKMEEDIKNAIEKKRGEAGGENLATKLNDEKKDGPKKEEADKPK